MQKIVWRTLVLVAMSCLYGCGDSVEPPSIGYSAPRFHSHPSWLNADELLFESLGATAFGPDWFEVDSSSVGVVKWDVVSGDCGLAIKSGLYTAVARSNQKYFCLLGSYSGPIVEVDADSTEVVDESMGWHARRDLAVSHDGNLIAWDCFGLDHDIGIWVYRVQDKNYSYIGLGSYPTWHPTRNVLLFRSEPEGEKPLAVQYDYATGQLDTTLVFEDNESCQYFAFSPDGSKIAFFRVSLVGGASGLCVADLSDGQLRQINQQLGKGLCWGDRGIVYSNNCFEYDDPSCGVLWFVDPGSWESTQLTERLQFIFDCGDTSVSRASINLRGNDSGAEAVGRAIDQ